jgi:hypothetical protein
MPFWKFVIQYQTCTATTAGIDQTRTSPVSTRMRIGAVSRTSRRATKVPSTIVSATFTAVNTIVRTSVSQNTESERTER